jgi:hypothetical protein
MSNLQRFVAILKSNEGCDHSISCGVKAIQLDASDVKHAGVILKQIVKTDFNAAETKLSSLSFFEVKERYSVDLNKWYAEIEQEEAKSRENAEKERELAEFERLKKKYNL